MILRTDCDWLYPNALFQVCIVRIIGVLASQDLLTAESVYESCATFEDNTISGA